MRVIWLFLVQNTGKHVLTNITVRIPTIQVVLVIQVDGFLQSFLRGRGPLQDLFCPVHAQKSVHLALPHHLNLNTHGKKLKQAHSIIRTDLTYVHWNTKKCDYWGFPPGSLSHDVISSGWLGSKHQLVNWLLEAHAAWRDAVHCAGYKARMCTLVWNPARCSYKGRGVSFLCESINSYQFALFGAFLESAHTCPGN